MARAGHYLMGMLVALSSSDMGRRGLSGGEVGFDKAVDGGSPVACSTKVQTTGDKSQGHNTDSTSGDRVHNNKNAEPASARRGLPVCEDHASGLLGLALLLFSSAPFCVFEGDAGPGDDFSSG